MEIIDSNTRFYIDLNVKTKRILGWGYGQRQKLEQNLPGTNHCRIFITKGQYNKLEKNNKMKVIIDTIRKELKQNADLNTKASGQKFFKEQVKLYGVKNAVVSKISKTYNNDILSLDKEEVFSLCEKLLESGYMEESFIACNWSYLIRKNFEPSDFGVFEKWLKSYVFNWATCDTLCNHTIGAFIEKYPKYLNNLKIWAKSKNRWVRRASAVSLIVPAKHGKFLDEIFEIADILLLDQEDLVQKGYGWMLKVASQPHQKEVFKYVLKNKEKMPRTALRYAIEKMPDGLRVRAMAK